MHCIVAWSLISNQAPIWYVIFNEFRAQRQDDVLSFSGCPSCRNVLNVSISAFSDDNLTLGYLVPKLDTRLAAVLCEAQAPNADKR